MNKSTEKTQTAQDAGRPPFPCKPSSLWIGLQHSPGSEARQSRSLDGEDRSGRIEGEGKGDHIGRAMIEHLRGRERALEPLGWTGREAEWIALVCLHSGVFTRAQFCHYFNT